MTVFARIDHGAGANEAALPLRPTELVVFGSARAGTPLMQAAQTIGIDLPLKRWSGKTKLEPHGSATTIHFGLRTETTRLPTATSLLRVMGEILAAIAREATGNVGDAS